MLPNRGTAEFAVTCFLRLKKDQDCYNFFKWCAATQTGYDSPAQPFASVANADMLEAARISHEDATDGQDRFLNFIACMILLKVRIYMELQTLLRATTVNYAERSDPPLTHQSSEEGDSLLAYTSGHPALRGRTLDVQTIATVVADIRELYIVINAKHFHFWTKLYQTPTPVASTTD
jgi:hypothetical protein